MPNLTVEPAYPGINDSESYERYTFRFTRIAGDAIRIFGEPGGSADFVSAGEPEVYAQ